MRGVYGLQAVGLEDGKLTGMLAEYGRDPIRKLARAAALVVLVVAHESRLDPMAREQLARVAGVLAGDHVRLAEHAQHAQRDVLEVSDRSGADDEPAGHRPRH